MIKTDTAKSPLLKPVIERDYTRGLAAAAEPAKEVPHGGGSAATQDPPPGASSAGTQQQPGAGASFNLPPDDTKEFQFDDMPEGGDIKGDDGFQGVNLSAASAKAFANFAGNALQVYVPRLSFNYCKVDMDSVIVNIEKQLLAPSWRDAFEKINANTEEKLKIPDEEIVMWKKACKEWLESENIAFANPRTAFIAATLLLLGTHTARAIQLHRANVDFMRQALEHSRPDLFMKTKKEETEKTEENGRKAA